jgi:uncharacterized membrane protein YcaP (DUF421 family)
MHSLIGGWDLLGRTLIASIIGYVSLLFLLRASGKRTRAKMCPPRSGSARP